MNWRFFLLGLFGCYAVLMHYNDEHLELLAGNTQSIIRVHGQMDAADPLIVLQAEVVLALIEDVREARLTTQVVNDHAIETAFAQLQAVREAWGRVFPLSEDVLADEDAGWSDQSYVHQDDEDSGGE